MSLFRVRNTLGAAFRPMLLVTALCATSVAQALSIGEINLHSMLGQPLRASVALGHLGSLSEQQVSVGSAPEADYRKLGVELASSPATIRYELTVDAKGYASVLLSTEQPVVEPMLDMVMEVRWPTGRTVRQFTVLLDLPRH
jgi:pilus assembly protein FimV